MSAHEWCVGVAMFGGVLLGGHVAGWIAYVRGRNDGRQIGRDDYASELRAAKWNPGRSYHGRAFAVDGETGAAIWCGCGDSLFADDVVCGACFCGTGRDYRPSRTDSPQPGATPGERDGAGCPEARSETNPNTETTNEHA